MLRRLSSGSLDSKPASLRLFTVGTGLRRKLPLGVKPGRQLPRPAENPEPAAKQVRNNSLQITIPLPVRDRLGLKPGDHVEFLFEEGQTVIRPARESEPVPPLDGRLEFGRLPVRGPRQGLGRGPAGR
ncbi:MAG: AbrB/MazE/SpoVT family DNA-binding domain-containing protein [Bryobacterales bacterium]|nr:AbrB/MazE/SpoVT family DNA-binding domain-containing protein [Bryobacterales bacterium]